MNRNILFTLTLLLTVVWGSAAVADDLMPPDFRGQPNSAFAEFQGGSDPTQPLELAGSDFPGGGFPRYMDDPDGATGPIQPGGTPQITRVQPITPYGEIIDFFMPNVVDDLPLKLFQLQITYEITDATFPSQIAVEGNPIDGVSGPDLVDMRVFTPSEPDDPTLKWEKWVGQIRPNPDYEIFTITAPGNLHQVVIDTISIPEPASILLLGFGGLALLRRRRT